MVTKLPVTVGTPRLASAFAEMDHLFNRFFGNGGSPAEGWNMPVAIWEETDRTLIEADMPGVNKDALEITVEKGVLRISGERKQPEGERNYLYNGLQYGRFERTFRLPEWADPNSIQAELKDGVLRLSLGRLPESQPKKIEVQAT